MHQRRTTHRGCDQGRAIHGRAPKGTDRRRLLQRPADGVYGPHTVDAVKQLQIDNHLPVTGLVDQATALALDKKVQAANNASASAALVETSALQAVLKVAGYWTGPVDGKWTPELTAALKQMQTALGVPATGVVDPATLSALESASGPAKGSATTTTTSAPSS